MTDVMHSIARFFDLEYADYDEDLDVIEACARRTGGPVLELGCGTGRAMISLAQAGFHVTGVDASVEMLAIARRKVGDASLSHLVNLVEGDFSQVTLGGPYRFAFAVMNTFLHLLSTKDQLRALAHWRAHLAPRGLLLLEILHPDATGLADLDGRLVSTGAWESDSGTTVMKILARTVDVAEQTLHVQTIYDEVLPGGECRRTVAGFDLRYVHRFEAELLLERAGFTLEGVYGSWAMDPLRSESERMIFLARRRGN